MTLPDKSETILYALNSCSFLAGNDEHYLRRLISCATETYEYCMSKNEVKTANEFLLLIEDWERWLEEIYASQETQTL